MKTCQHRWDELRSSAFDRRRKGGTPCRWACRRRRRRTRGGQEAKQQAQQTEACDRPKMIFRKHNSQAGDEAGCCACARENTTTTGLGNQNRERESSRRRACKLEDGHNNDRGQKRGKTEQYKRNATVKRPLMATWGSGGYQFPIRKAYLVHPYYWPPPLP